MATRERINYKAQWKFSKERHKGENGIHMHKESITDNKKT